MQKTLTPSENANFTRSLHAPPPPPPPVTQPYRVNEVFYDKKVEGIIIRSHHEYGEKNSKYFLNLEKRNNIKKRIRKLYVSGTISTNPFEIMDAQNSFYSKLYSKQTINLDGEDTKIFFENSNILRLSDELSASCEGKITLQECEIF